MQIILGLGNITCLRYIYQGIKKLNNYMNFIDIQPSLCNFKLFLSFCFCLKFKG